jgi:hypothetical protein
MPTRRELTRAGLTPTKGRQSALIKKKQLGDAGEMLVAAQLTLHGIPAYTVPVNWPACDVAADPPGRRRQTISVKTRTLAGGGNIGWRRHDSFDWLAVVVLHTETLDFIIPDIFIIPRTDADALADKRAREAKKHELTGL